MNILIKYQKYSLPITITVTLSNVTSEDNLKILQKIADDLQIPFSITLGDRYISERRDETELFRLDYNFILDSQQENMQTIREQYKNFKIMLMRKFPDIQDCIFQQQQKIIVLQHYHRKFMRLLFDYEQMGAESIFYVQEEVAFLELGASQIREEIASLEQEDTAMSQIFPSI